MTSPVPAYGLIRRSAGDRPRPAARAGDRIVDLADVAGIPPAVAGAETLDPLLALGSTGWTATHEAVRDHLHADGASRDVDGVEVLLPVRPGDYVDFYASEHHATNVGRLFRPEGEPLLPNWRHVPVGYHGRAGSIVVSGTPIRRPRGLLGPDEFGPSRRLDLELELGFVIGTAVPMGASIAPVDAADHVFGVVLVNDWSARDIQAFEYQPLGPFAGKSFATSIAGWITPLSALPRTEPPTQDPLPVPALRTGPDTAPETGLDIDLAWSIDGEVLGRTNARHLYWTFAQQLAHLTTNGAGVRRGDLFASGTISGPDPGSEGCLLEATGNGSHPLARGDGSPRTWLADGETVVLHGCWAGGTLAEVTGTVLATPEVS